MRRRSRWTAIAGVICAVPALGAGQAMAGGGAGVKAVPVASFAAPTYVAAAPGRPRLLYVTEKGGVVRVLRRGEPLAKPFLDISSRVTNSGEQGLLSIAFAPDFRRSRRFYLYFNSSDGCTGGCPIHVEEYKARRGKATRARPQSRRLVISIAHPDATNHNGGTVAFGPDGKLWLATGDGGGGGDQFQNARNPNSLLGKLLRIKPLRRNPDRPGYRVPKGNPFAGRPGADEMWSYGLRNPYRFSFDRRLGAIAIGDVGQNSWEEVSIVTTRKARGAGFGWPEFEGNFDYPESPPYDPPEPPLAPIHTYPNPALGRSSVTGGVIARDPQLPQLRGRYLFADFYAGQIMSFVPSLETNQAVDLQPLDVPPIENLVAFASGRKGQLYVLSLSGPLYRLEPEGEARARGVPPVGDGTGGVDFGAVGDGQFEASVNVAFAPGEADKAYVVEQDGTVEVLVNNAEAGDFLDVRDQTNGSGEQGLLGLAFHPDYQDNDLVYAYYTDSDNGDIVVAEFEAPNPLDADEGSRRQVIRIRHRFASNHNGGQLLFGPDGRLYLGSGDGGGAGDPRENAQDKRSLLGKLLRIDPLDPPGPRAHSVPDGNPFVGRKGKDQIFARGLRNPFRFSFDPLTGRIAIGDVGQDRFEEVDYESRKGLKNANFGWDRFEGRKRYDDGDTARTPKRKRHDRPIHVYRHSTDGFSCSVTGGVVVRDPTLTNLYGRYLYADFCAGQLRSFIPKQRGARDVRKLADTFPSPTSFTSSPFDNRIYVTSLEGDVMRLGPQE